MKRLSTILLLSLAVHAGAQEHLSLNDAIQKALEHNFDIRIAQLSAEQAARNNTMGNAGMSPNINANAGLTGGSANSHIEFADSRKQDVNNAGTFNYNGAVTLNWTLFDGGRMFLLKNKLNKLEDIGALQFKAQVQATVSQVIQAYAAVVWQRQQGLAIDTSLALATIRMELSRVKYETGSAAKVDFLQARVDYNSRQSDSLAQVAKLGSSLATLNLLMGEQAEKEYAVDDQLELNTTLQPSDRSRLEEINLSLAATKKLAEASKLDARIAKAYHLPILAMNGSYNYTNTESQAGFALVNRSNGYSGGLTLSLPVFQGGNIRRVAKVASLQAMRDQLVYDKQNTDIGRQYRSAWRDYETSVAAYKLEQQNISYAKENMDIQKARFKVGIASTLETREAENSYVQALVRYYTAAYNLKVNETRVLELESALVK